MCAHPVFVLSDFCRLPCNFRGKIFEKCLKNNFIEGIDWPCLHRVTKLFAGCTLGLKVDGYFPFNLRSGPILAILIHSL